MPINYDAILTTEQKQEIVEMRIKQFAMQAYTLELEKIAQQNLSDNQAVQSIEQQINVLDATISVHEQELNNLSANNDTPES